MRTSACESVREAFSEYIGGTLKRAKETDVSQHLAGCAACRKELEEFEKTVGLVQAIGQPAVPPDMPRRVRERLKQQHEIHGRIWSVALHPLFGTTLAAAAVVAVFAYGYRMIILPARTAPLHFVQDSAPKTDKPEPRAAMPLPTFLAQTETPPPAAKSQTEQTPARPAVLPLTDTTEQSPATLAAEAAEHPVQAGAGETEGALWDVAPTTTPPVQVAAARTDAMPAESMALGLTARDVAPTGLVAETRPEPDEPVLIAEAKPMPTTGAPDQPSQAKPPPQAEQHRAAPVASKARVPTRTSAAENAPSESGSAPHTKAFGAVRPEPTAGAANAAPVRQAPTQAQLTLRSGEPTLVYHTLRLFAVGKIKVQTPDDGLVLVESDEKIEDIVVLHVKEKDAPVLIAQLKKLGTITKQRGLPRKSAIRRKAAQPTSNRLIRLEIRVLPMR